MGLGPGVGPSSGSTSELDSDGTGVDRQVVQSTSMPDNGASYGRDANQLFDPSTNFGGSLTLGAGGVMVQTTPELGAVSVTGFFGEGAGAWASATFDGSTGIQAGFFVGLNDGSLDLMLGTDFSTPEPNFEVGVLAGGQELSVGINGPAIFDRVVDWLSEPVRTLEQKIERLYDVPALP